MTTKKKKPELVFMPGCFDEFEGTQEELDQLVEEIKRMADSGEFKDARKIVDFDEENDLNEMIEDLPEEEFDAFMDKLRDTAESRKRALH